ncbi:hypothetical protein HPB49_004570 [Dermacentor silvarum]|uniref:Uncharacterized protein n=1 Tax=Dermacentor silvarum TaxID=543639 RepID=A0ACB8DUG7_DERSI|nr:hypothetical protein HPB49_004570 [Dermacentor silvarum]
MASHSASYVTNISAPAKGNLRMRFSSADDIQLLREVRDASPFGDQSGWAQIAAVLNAATGKTFTARNVRERAELMIWRYSVDDRKNLRKSGTEEEYCDKEHMLQAIIAIMKNEGLKIRAPRCVNNITASQPARERLTSTQEAARRSAANARDAAANAYMLDDDGTARLFNNMINGDDDDASAEQQCSQLPTTSDSTAPAASAQSPCNDQGPSVAASGSVLDCDSPRTTARSEPKRGK